MRASISLLLLASLAAPAASQSASFTFHGSPCTTTEGTPTLGHIGLPVLGQSMDLTYRGPNTFAGGGYIVYQPHLVIGFGLLAPGVTIPESLLFAQPRGCTLYATHDVVLPMALTAAGDTFATSFRLGIPSDPILLGGAFFPQWLTVYTQCGIIPPCQIHWITSSAAGIAVIGF